MFAPDCPNTHGVISKEVVDMLKIANFCMICTNPNCKEQSICKGESPFLCHECGVNKRVCSHTTAKNSERLASRVKSNASRIKANKTLDHGMTINDTLMLTERVTVINPKTKEKSQVVIFHDSGSSATMVSHQLDKFSFPLGVITNVEISGVSEEFSTILPSVKKVALHVATKNGKIPLHAIQVKDIAPISSAKIKVPKNWETLFPSKNLVRSGEIQILLGADNCHLYPVEIERIHKNGETLMLYRSEITGSYLLYGQDSENITFKKNGSNIRKVHMRKTTLMDHDFNISNDIICLGHEKDNSPDQETKSSQSRISGHQQKPSLERESDQNWISDNYKMSKQDYKMSKQDDMPNQSPESGQDRISGPGRKTNPESGHNQISNQNVQCSSQNVQCSSQNVTITTQAQVHADPDRIDVIDCLEEINDDVANHGKQIIQMRKTTIKTLKNMVLDDCAGDQWSMEHNNGQNDVKINVKMSKIDQLQKQFSEQCTAENLQTPTAKHDAKLRSAEEMKMKEMMKYNADEKTWTVNFLYNDKLSQLEDNYNVAKKRALALNKKLMKLPEIRSQVNAEIDKYLKEGMWTEEKFDDDLKCHYLPLNYVKSQSDTTPTRLIIDPSAKGCNGISLNCTQRYGFSSVGDLRGILLKFRAAQRVSVGDISRFFNSFNLTTEDRSLRRMLIPKEGFGNCENPTLIEIVPTKMGFGDRAAPILAIIGKNSNVVAFITETPDDLQDDVKRALLDQTYMDDVFSDVPWDQDINTVTEAINQLIMKGGMKIKQWTHEHEEPTKFLGYHWKPQEDVLTLKNWLNLETKQRGSKIAPDLTSENLNDFSESLSRRSILRAQGQIFDPLLLAAPFIIKMRLLYAEVCNVTSSKNEKIEWDKPLPEDLKKKFFNLYTELEALKSFKITRSVIPKALAGKLPEGELCICVDGSLLAYAAAAYVRFKQDDKIYCNLLAAGMKIAGSRKLTPPRAELLAAELGVLLAMQIKKETSAHLKIQQTTFLSDSKVTLARIKLSSANMDVFTGSRIAFIQDETRGDRWLYCPGEHNPADLPTRSLTTYEEMMSDKWLQGGFLTEPEEDWPTEDIDSKNIQDQLSQEKEKMITANMKVNKTQATEMSTLAQIAAKHRNLDTAINIVSLLYKWKYQNLTEAQLREKAEMAFVLDAMPETKKMLETVKMSQGDVIQENEVAYLKLRSLPTIKDNKVVILKSSTPFAKLLIRHFHDTNHMKSSKRVQAHIHRRGYYIPRLHLSLVAEKNSCPLCKKLTHSPVCQVMGDVKPHRFMRSKPFSNCMLDLAGPFKSYDSIKKRTTGKVWALVVSCAYTRATFTYCLENYTTDALVSALSRHKARFGAIREIYSDLGTNLVGAATVDAEGEEDPAPQIRDLQRHLTQVKWHFEVPRAPWMMGAVESAVKLLKEQYEIMRIRFGDQKLSALEYETLFARISATVNSRPIVMGGEPNVTLTPNDLMYGHNHDVPHQDVPQENNLLKRAKTIQENLTAWWRAWADEQQLQAGNLPKWRQGDQNLQVGDTVMLLDSPNKVGSYILGNVVETHPDQNNRVRKVTVEHITPTGQKTQVKRPSRGLSKLISMQVFDNDSKDDDDAHDDDIDDDDGIDLPNSDTDNDIDHDGHQHGHVDQDLDADDEPDGHIANRTRSKTGLR